MLFDFHMHSTYSDGSSTMVEIFEKAKELGLKALAITDHDTTLGLDMEKKLSKEYSIPFISAVEFTAMEQGTKFHVLAYNVDAASQELKDYSVKLLEYLNKRSSLQIEMLQRQGIDIPKEEFFKESNGGPLYRAKLLRTLARYNYLDVGEIMTSLKKYFGEGGPCYLPEDYKYMDFESMAKMIKRNNGVVVLAHPTKIKKKNSRLYYELINSELLDGIEVYHPSIEAEVKNELEKIILNKNLLCTGGSDYHGLYNKRHTPLCGIEIPEKVYMDLLPFIQ